MTGKLHSNKTTRRMYLIGGFVSLALGLIGLALPVMPTAPFVILAAFCFSRGSERWHKWLVSHPKLGPPIRDWEQHGVIRLKAKIIATVVVTISWGISATFAPIPVWLKIGVTAIILAVMIFIWTRPSAPSRGALNG